MVVVSPAAAAVLVVGIAAVSVCVALEPPPPPPHGSRDAGALADDAAADEADRSSLFWARDVATGRYATLPPTSYRTLDTPLFKRHLPDAGPHHLDRGIFLRTDHVPEKRMVAMQRQEVSNSPVLK